MKVLILATHYPVSSGRYAFNALKRLGHDVRSAGHCTGGNIWGMALDERHTWVPDAPEDGWTPELVIVMDSALNVAHSLYDCPLVVYGVDNHVRDYAGVEADHLFLAHGHGLRMGEPNATWLPCGYDPQWFIPGPPWAQRDLDAALIGVQYGPRAELLYALHAQVPGLKIAYGTGAVFGEYAQVHHRAKWSLVRSAAGDVAQRVWETAAMGCLVIKDANPDDAALGLENGENCLIYNGVDEAVEAVRWAQANPEHAEHIAQMGQRWALPGTWDARLAEIIEWAEWKTKDPAEKEWGAVKGIVDSMPGVKELRQTEEDMILSALLRGQKATDDEARA